MGQYHYVVNLDKKQFINPHKMGDGLKLWEQMHGGTGSTSNALMILLAVSNGRGGGDVEANPLVGSWGGDRIAIVGDYTERADLPARFKADSIYSECTDAGAYEDISGKLRAYFQKHEGVTYSGDGWATRSVAGEDQKPATSVDMAIAHPGGNK